MNEKRYTFILLELELAQQFDISRNHGSWEGVKNMELKHGRFNIIDAHAHIFNKVSGFGYCGESHLLNNGKLRWANGDETDFLPKELGDSFGYEKLLGLMDQAGVSKAVLLQGSYYGFCNEYVYEAQSEYPDRFYGMGTFDPYCGDYLRIMKRLIEKLKFRGFKFEISQAYGMTGYHAKFNINSERMHRVWEYANEAGLTVSLDFGTFDEPSFQVDELAKIAKQYRNIVFVVEHLFAPAKNRFELYKASLEKLRDYGHVNFTVAAMPVASKPEPYPYPTACRYIEIAKNVVSVKRLMWGSDVPTTLVYSHYSEMIDFIADSRIFDDDELTDIYSENAKKIYRL